MTLIKHLTEELCATCHAAPCAEEVTSVHVNGQQFESRKFKCGRQVRWVPNFERAEVVQLCPSDPLRIARESRRKLIVGGLIAKAQELSMTNEEMENLTRFLTYSHW